MSLCDGVDSGGSSRLCRRLTRQNPLSWERTLIVSRCLVFLQRSIYPCSTSPSRAETRFVPSPSAATDAAAADISIDHRKRDTRRTWPRSHYMDLNYRWSYLLADGQRCSILRVLHGRDMHALSGIDRRKYRNEDAQV